MRSRKEIESEHNFRRLMGHCKCINIHIMGVLGEEQKRKKKKAKRILKEIMTENITNFLKKILIYALKKLSILQVD